MKLIGNLLIGNLVSSVLPFLIIGGLLYAGLFVKPKAVGASIKPVAIGPRDAFYGVAVPADNVVWAVGRGAKVVRSDDGGQSWTAQTVPTKANLQSIAAFDLKRAVAVGNATTVIRTEDGGATWSAAADIPGTGEGHKLMRVRAGDGGQAWAVGELGAILASGDYGRTWKIIGRQEDIVWNDIAALGPKTAVVVGEFGNIRRSADGGATWEMVPSPVKSSLTAVKFADDQRGVAVGLEGVVLVSGDGGRKWQSVRAPTTEHLFDVARTASGWAVAGDKGIVLRAEEPTGTWHLSRISPGDYAWHTELYARGDRLYFAGATFGVIDGNAPHYFK